jgi:hypothetical protein
MECASKKKTENLIYRAAAVLDNKSTRLTRVATTLVWVAGTKMYQGRHMPHATIEYRSYSRNLDRLCHYCF